MRYVLPLSKRVQNYSVFSARGSFDANDCIVFDVEPVVFAPSHGLEAARFNPGTVVYGRGVGIKTWTLNDGSSAYPHRRELTYEDLSAE